MITRFWCRSMMSLLAGLVLLGFMATPTSWAQTPATRMTITPDPVPQNSDLTIALEGFQSKESIAVWLTLPDGRVVPITAIVVAMNADRYEARADENGAASISAFIDWSFPTGVYAVTARGNLSGIEVIAPFTLTPPPAVAPDPRVLLTLSYLRSEGETVLRFEGVGFVREEAVALWVTRPDNAVQDLGLVDATEGFFVYEVPAASIGGAAEHTLTAAGRTSGRRGVLVFVPNP